MNSLESYMIVASAVFCIGLYNVMTRRNAVAILMGIELILNSANINFIAFNKFGFYQNMNLDGHLISMFVIVLAAAEAAVALAIIINLYRNIGSVDVEEASTLKG